MLIFENVSLNQNSDFKKERDKICQVYVQSKQILIVLFELYNADQCKHNIFQSGMYLGDASDIESHLNVDWSVLLKNLKIREDNHLQLLQYNKHIITKRRIQDDELFVNDQILQYHQEIKRLTTLIQEMDAEEKDILDKYETTTVSFPQIIKLMGRVGARILQTCQSSQDKCKLFDDELTERHFKMKNTLIKIINQKDKINLEEITRLVIGYSKNKLGNELDKLKKLVKSMENGEYDGLQDVYKPKPRNTVLSLEKKPDVSVQKFKTSSVGKDDRSHAKEDRINQDKMRKQRQKLATKLVNGMYSMMELSKQQFTDDMCSYQPHKEKRLFDEIFLRNKFNYQQILAFEAKKDMFYSKVALFREMMEKESRRLSEALIRKPLKQAYYANVTQSCIVNPKQGLSLQNTNVNSAIQLEPVSEKRNTSSRYRINSPKNKRESKQFVNVTNIALQQQQFNHLKFDKTNQEVYPRTNRNKLPQIDRQIREIRGSSLEHRMEASRSWHLRQDTSDKKPSKDQDPNNIEEMMIRNQRPRQKQHNFQRTKMALKNIEVGVGGAVRKEEEPLSGKEKKKIQPNPMQYTFYVRKSGYKFYQPKHNIIF